MPYGMTGKKIISCICAMLFIASSAEAGNAPPPAAPGGKFMPLPARKNKNAKVKILPSFYEIQPASRQKVRMKSAPAPVSKAEPPPPGNADKLLLYVYDEMR